MLSETISAQLKIRLNYNMTCNDFCTFVQNQPELIKCGRSKEKQSHIKKFVPADSITSMS
jgi:hypothetical protein